MKFDTGITEHWNLKKDPVRVYNTFELPYNRPYFNDYDLKIHRQFENNPLYPEDCEILKDHFILKKSDLKKAGWCDVRFKVHDLAVQLVEEGFIPIRYTESLLREDYEALLAEDLSKYQSTIIRFSTKPTLPTGRRLIMHFLPCYASECWTFEPLYQAINSLMYTDITREGIVYHMSRPYQKSIHPTFYRAIFRQWFDIKDKKVYDLHPEWGFKALGILAEGGHYYCHSSHLDGLQNLGRFIGGQVSSPNQSRYDLAILSGTKPIDINNIGKMIKNFKHIADTLMITVSRNDWRAFIETYKPFRVIRINEGLRDASMDNYIMFIRQK